MVIFGAGGDLTKRKLIPAIYNLAKGKLLPEKFAIIGVSVEPFSTDEFRQHATDDIREYSTSGVDRNPGTGSSSASTTFPAISTIRSFTRNSASTLGQVEKEQGTQGNCLFYLATSPDFFPGRRQAAWRRQG